MQVMPPDKSSQRPPEIRKACMILGLKPERLTIESVNQAWKKQMAAPGVHPDLGGDQEAAIFLYTAKDTLLKWIGGSAWFWFWGRFR